MASKPVAAGVRIEATPVALGKASHLCIVVTLPSGDEVAFRGGPSANAGLSPVIIATASPSSPTGDSWGAIRMDSAAYKAGFVDYAPTATKTPVDINGQKLDDVVKSFGQVAKQIADRQIPYHPLNQNSNSAVGTMLRRSGCTTTAPKDAYGYDVDLIPLSKL